MLPLSLKRNIGSIMDVNQLVLFINEELKFVFGEVIQEKVESLVVKNKSTDDVVELYNDAYKTLDNEISLVQIQKLYNDIIKYAKTNNSSYISRTRISMNEFRFPKYIRLVRFLLFSRHYIKKLWLLLRSIGRVILSPLLILWNWVNLINNYSILYFHKQKLNKNIQYFSMIEREAIIEQIRNIDKDMEITKNDIFGFTTIIIAIIIPIIVAIIPLIIDQAISSEKNQPIIEQLMEIRKNLYSILQKTQ
jgi:hypothetical protein